MRLNKRIWQRLPDRLRDLRVIRSYGAWLHTLVCLHANRQQYFGTFFFRNRPALELMRRLVAKRDHGATVNLTVLACSVGAEVYSILWTIRSARPDLIVRLHAVDVSKEILDFAANGIYSPRTSKMVGASIFDRMTEQEKRAMFDWEGDQARVKSWLREGITWRCGDATDPEWASLLGPQDIVVGSNFLCHMAPREAETCLRNIARLVGPAGYLFITGVDLDVRTRVALDLGWKPLPELLAEIHDGDPSVRADWPWQWWGLEPLERRRSDWQIRYAAVFQVHQTRIVS
ncbi:MAG TPA: CheR family methyltransferase [Candidatus Sulfopaludibacter sp.]|nr:CheR family methyltransferase [Candidatus Sulfopaludibacter sp.]